MYCFFCYFDVPSDHFQSKKANKKFLAVCRYVCVRDNSRTAYAICKILSANGFFFQGAGLIGLWTLDVVRQVFRLGTPGSAIEPNCETAVKENDRRTHAWGKAAVPGRRRARESRNSRAAGSSLSARVLLFFSE